MSFLYTKYLSNSVYIAANNATIEEKALATIQCDGINDNVEIQAALNTYKLVLLSSGTFSINAELTGDAIIKGKGKFKTFFQMGSQEKCFNLGTTADTLISTNQIGNYAENKIIIPTTASLTASLAKGDYIWHGTNEVFHARNEYYRMEWNRVLNISSTAIQLEKPTIHSVTAAGNTARIYKVTMSEDCGIDGVTVLHGTHLDSNFVCQVKGEGAFIRNFRYFGKSDFSTRIGVVINKAKDGIIENSEAYNCLDSNTGAGRTGYGFNIDASWGVTVNNIKASFNKHGFDGTANNYNPTCQNVVVTNFHFNKNETQSVNNHGGCYDWTFDTGFESIGILNRGRKFTARNIKGLYVMQLGEPNNSPIPLGNGFAATDVILENIEGFNTESARSFLRILHPVNNAEIKNLSIEGYVTKELIEITGNGVTNLIVDNVSSKFAQGVGIYLINIDREDNNTVANATGEIKNCTLTNLVNTGTLVFGQTDLIVKTNNTIN